MRFESVQCLPVWSFNGPSRPTGYVLVRYANLYWLVTVFGFQGSSCSGFPAYPAVLPAACRLCCVKRQGGTLRIRLDRVNSFSELSSDHVAAGVPRPDRGTKKRLPIVSEGVHTTVNDRVYAASSTAYVIVSERLSVFNTRSGLS